MRLWIVPEQALAEGGEGTGFAHENSPMSDV